MIVRVPQGFSRFTVGSADVVARDDVAAAIRESAGARSLYAWAAAHPEKHAYEGRVPAWSAPLPLGGPRVVVRHSHHGGLLGPLLGDLFFAPTRAPFELLVSLLLQRAGVPTPAVVAFAMYRAGPLLRRSDVVSLEVTGQDLGAALQDAHGRLPWLAPVSELLQGLTRVGAWHPDLNVKNILLSNDPSGATRAFVLDVDRIQFHAPGDPIVRDANLTRLVRSLRKWGRTRGFMLDEAELALLRNMAGVP